MGDEFFQDVEEYQEEPSSVSSGRGGALDPYEVHQQLLSSGVNPDRFVVASSASSSPAPTKKTVGDGEQGEKLVNLLLLQQQTSIITMLVLASSEQERLPSTS